jgi:DNA-binding NtrC family response regulator
LDSTLVDRNGKRADRARASRRYCSRSLASLARGLRANVSTSERGHQMTLPTPSAKPGRFQVLVVDDDQGMLASLANVLSDDFDVTTCNTPHKAMDLLQSRKFHVICSDFKMPGMDGLELLQWASERPHPIGCLLLTGSDEYRPESNRYYVLLKPFDPERLIAIVAQLARVSDMKRSVHALSSAMRREQRP